MDISGYIIKTGLLGFLFMAALLDYRQRSLNINFLCISFAAGFLLQTISGELALWEMLAGAALGGAAAVLSKLSRQAIGYGDSFMIAVCGAWLGFFENILLILCSFLFLAVFGILAMVLKKAKAKDSLPFAPFLLAGYAAVLAVGG